MHTDGGSRRSSATSTVLGIIAATAGVLGLGALWTMLNVQTGSLNGWAALLAAVDAALLLRLAGMRGGWPRVAVGIGAVAATVALVAFLTAATRIGLAMGLRPWDSATRMGSGLAWAMAQSAASAWDVLALALSLLLAWWLCR